MPSIYDTQDLLAHPGKIDDYIDAIRTLNSDINIEEPNRWGPLHDTRAFRTEALEGLCSHYKKSGRVAEAEDIRRRLDKLRKPAGV